MAGVDKRTQDCRWQEQNRWQEQMQAKAVLIHSYSSGYWNVSHVIKDPIPFRIKKFLKVVYLKRKNASNEYRYQFDPLFPFVMIKHFHK